MITLIATFCVLIEHCVAEHDSETEMGGLDMWLITAISIGATAILLLLLLLCCCCCPACKNSNPEPNGNRLRRSSSFRFNRSSTPTAPIALQDNVGNDQERIHSLQSTETNDLLNSDSFANATAPYPPAYSTLPSSGHMTIATSNENTNSMAEEILPTATNNIRLERSDTISSEVWYDASTLER